MNLQTLGIELCIKYVVPAVKKIIKSAISKLGKNLYEKLYDRFKSALESLGEAIQKMLDTDDPEKLQKRLDCCELGLKFFEKIYQVLDEVLPEYKKAIEQAKNKEIKEVSGE